MYPFEFTTTSRWPRLNPGGNCRGDFALYPFFLVLSALLLYLCIIINN